MGQLFPPLANWAVGNRTAPWLLEKMTGIAQGRKLPAVAARSFLRQRRRSRRGPTRRAGAKVLYFVDVYANWFDTQVAEAFVGVLEHNRISVFVHPGQQQSAMAMITIGCRRTRRRIAGYNVSLLADAIRQGYQIVATEPSAALG